MASNPMQRQARNFFLLGMVFTMLIAGAIIALLFMQIQKERKEKEELKLVSVYVLTQDVKSGDVITKDMFKTLSVPEETVPSDCADPDMLLNAYKLFTKDGVPITSDFNNGVQHLYVNGDKSSEVLKDEVNGKLYIQRNNNKEYIETQEAPVVAKIDAKANTVLSKSIAARSYELPTNDVREQEYNCIVLPIDLQEGDHIDVRLILPNGQDFIVVSKKRVSIPSNDGGTPTDTIHINLAEEETVSLSCAIVEAFKIDGAKLYATKYTDAGIQEAASPTYVVNAEVASLMDSDPNIVEKAKTALLERYNAKNLKSMREQFINNALSQYGENERYKTKMDESIKSTLESRQKYLESLGTPTTTTSTETSTN